MNHHVDRASEILGSQNLLAAALGVSKSAVGQWKEEGRRVPAEYCPVIERLTLGAVRCEELRPDIEWQVLRKSRPRLKARRPTGAGAVPLAASQEHSPEVSHG